MIYRLAALCSGLSIVAAAQVSIVRPAQVARTERVEFAPGGTIRLSDSFGDLFIEGWDQPVVEMTLIKELQDYRSPWNAPELLERVHFTTGHPSGNELVISTAVPPHRFIRHPFGGKGAVTVRYEIHVPRESRLIVHHAGGNILIDKVNGGIEASDREGDIVVTLPAPGPYHIDAKSKMGTVIADYPGKAHVKHFIGEAFAGTSEATAHPIHLRTGFGGITIKEMAPEAEP